MKFLKVIIVVCASLALPLVTCQDGGGVPWNACGTDERYRCVRIGIEATSKFQECKNGVYQQHTMNCEDLYPNGSSSICYSGRNGNPCGPPPPACTTEGYFPLIGGEPADSCRNYIVCAPINGAFYTKIGTCSTGEEFSPVTRTCTLKAIAGCSIPFTPTPDISTTTPGIPTTIVTPKKKCTPLRIRADDTSCRKYYLCIGLGVELNLKCPFGQKFSIPFNGCSLFGVDCGTRPL